MRKQSRHPAPRKFAPRGDPAPDSRPLIPEIPYLRRSRDYGQQHHHRPQSHADLFSPCRRCNQSFWYTKLTASSNAPRPRKLRIRYPWLSSTDVDSENLADGHGQQHQRLPAQEGRAAPESQRQQHRPKQHEECGVGELRVHPVIVDQASSHEPVSNLRHNAGTTSTRESPSPPPAG